MAAPVATELTRRRFPYLADLWNRREFAWYMAMGNIRAQNANTSFGLVWWVLGPLILGMVYLVIFGMILGIEKGSPNYIGFLLSGLFSFYFTRESLMAGANSILTNTKLVSTQRFPRLILPISAIIESAAGFIFSLIPFFLIAGLVGGTWPGFYTLLFIPVFTLHVMFNLGLTTAVAQLAIPFRDITNVIPYVVRIWLYTSPVLFSLDQRLENAPEAVGAVLRLNPMASILGLWRSTLLGYPLSAHDLVAATCWGVGLFVFGVSTFRINEHRMVRYL